MPELHFRETNFECPKLFVNVFASPTRKHRIDGRERERMRARKKKTFVSSFSLAHVLVHFVNRHKINHHLTYNYLSNVCMCMYVCVYVCDRCTATPLVPPTPNLARRTISVLGRFKAGESQDLRPQSRPRTLFSLARSAGTAIRPQDVAPSFA